MNYNKANSLDPNDSHDISYDDFALYSHMCELKESAEDLLEIIVDRIIKEFSETDKFDNLNKMEIVQIMKDIQQMTVACQVISDYDSLTTVSLDFQTRNVYMALETAKKYDHTKSTEGENCLSLMQTRFVSYFMTGNLTNEISTQLKRC